MAFPEAMICELSIFNRDGELSMTVAHTVSETVNVRRFGEEVLDLSYGEARALAKALRVIIGELEGRA